MGTECTEEHFCPRQLCLRQGEMLERSVGDSEILLSSQNNTHILRNPSGGLFSPLKMAKKEVILLLHLDSGDEEKMGLA